MLAWEPPLQRGIAGNFNVSAIVGPNGLLNIFREISLENCCRAKKREISFSLVVAQKAVVRGDVAYIAGCCFRSVACMNQVLFALNETYLLNEKGAVALAITSATLENAKMNRPRVGWAKRSVPI